MQPEPRFWRIWICMGCDLRGLPPSLVTFRIKTVNMQNEFFMFTGAFFILNFICHIICRNKAGKPAEK